MADNFVRIFAIPDVADVHRRLLVTKRLVTTLQVERAARRLPTRGLVATRARVDAIHRQFNTELNALAQTTADDASSRIRQRLQATARRPATGVRPHLSDNIVSRPLGISATLATGVVGVADEDRLNKVTNPMDPQDRPYWHAQEYGTRRHIGRVLKGYFYGTGYTSPEVPRARYAGAANPPHPIFVTAKQMAGPRGGKGGKAEIKHPIRARHFIRDGANAARTEWRLALHAIESATIAELRALRGR